MSERSLGGLGMVMLNGFLVGFCITQAAAEAMGVDDRWVVTSALVVASVYIAGIQIRRFAIMLRK